VKREVERKTPMSLTPLNLLAVFGAGLLSFLSPCVVALVPGYLAYLSGMSLEEVKSRSSARWQVSLQALWFVLGCTLFLTLLGAAAALLGSVLSVYQQVLERVGGLVLILLGIALTGLVPVPWVSGEHRVQFKPGPPTWWRSGLIGMTFGAGWSACAGPILGAVLVLTAAGSVALLQGMMVMLLFALGQGVPFVLVGLLVDRAGPFLRRIRRSTALLTHIGGIILILVGFFLLTGLLNTAG
jgi:cytochrome c-type biogenesis protein